MENPPSNEIVVTGMGAFSAAGGTAAALWDASLAGRAAGMWMIAAPEGDRIACCRAGRPRSRLMPPSAFERLDRFAQLGVAAAEEAWENAGLGTMDIDSRRVAVIVGSSRGPAETQRHAPLQDRPRLRPTAALYSTVSSLAGTLSSIFSARGPSLTVSATCASGAAAMGTAADMLCAGVCDVALVGGADAPLVPAVVAEMQASGVLGYHADPRRTCRPFDQSRNGIIVGEAAAFLVLERADPAKARGAGIRSRLTGWSAVCDAGHRSGMSEDARGVSEAVNGALCVAKTAEAAIDAVHLHGTGTTMNDAAEADVFSRMLGERRDSVPCFSIKPVTGHCLGASGALQAVVNVRALEEQSLPPTANCQDLDVDCRINVVRDEPWCGRIDSILTHSAGFWGNHAALLFRRA